MAYTTLSSLASAIAANAGVTPGSSSQASITSVGALEQGRRVGPPRVVWTPGNGELLAPNQDESDLSKIGYTHRLECAVTFLGATYDAADTLLRYWLAAAQRTQGNNCITPRATQYRDETLTGTNRHEITLIVDVDLPIVFETYTAADVDYVSQSGTITNP